MTGTEPMPEDALQPRGRALWDDVLGTYDVGPAEAVLVLELCRLADHIDRLQEATVTAPLTSPGSTGQAVAHPLLAELRAGRRQLVDLVAALHSPAPPADPFDTLAKSMAASTSARRRRS
ncbi:MAG: hypothetical protein ACR2FL_09550 [Nocardioidaceae bacterium]